MPRLALALWPAADLHYRGMTDFNRGKRARQSMLEFERAIAELRQSVERR